jgi:hypothetical protein
MTALPHPEHEALSTREALATSPVYQAYRILQVSFVAAPIIAGFDKFFNKLVTWDLYLAQPFVNLFGSARNFMLLVGVIEILAGIGVALKPRYFAYVVALWLAGIIMNLLMTGQYFDIALRDLGLCLGALALARLAQRYDVGMFGGLMKS